MSTQIEKRFWDKVDKTSTCWLWTGSISDVGYGKFNNADFSETYAHRISYVLAFGLIKADQDIHHRCGIRSCVRPGHLESLPRLDHRREESDQRGMVKASQIPIINTGVLATQEELIRELRVDGVDVSIRTLRYWRELRYLPPLTRNGMENLYDSGIKDRIFFLCLASPKHDVILSTLLDYIVEGDTFDVTRIEITRVEGVPTMVMHLRREGVLIKEIREGELHAFTRGY